VKTGADYFFHMKRLMQQSNVTYEFKEPTTTREIGGVVFDRLDLTFSLNGQSVDQSYYAARRGDHVVAIIETAGTPEEWRETSALIDTITFDKSE
jgi:hypothetical protein